MMDISERRMNPVAMTIIDPRKEYWQSWGLNQPPVPKPDMLPTGARHIYSKEFTTNEMAGYSNFSNRSFFSQ